MMMTILQDTQCAHIQNLNKNSKKTPSFIFSSHLAIEIILYWGGNNMRKKYIKRNIILLLIIIFFISTVLPIVSGSFKITSGEKGIISIQNRGDTLYVGGSGPGNYSSIQAAIDDAQYDDIIFVYSDIYFEHISIGKSITLIGEEKDSTIIDGSLTDNCIEITADSVIVDGFTIRKGVLGVNIIQSSGLEIKNNLIRNNWGGINLYQVTDSYFADNSITDSFFEGISPIQSSGNTFSGNKIFWNLYGILFKSSNDNFVFENDIKGNTRGIELVEQSNNNKIYHNNFYSNEEDNAYDDFENIWDDGYPSGGNYWDDYTGSDNDGDGIGDSSYEIPGDANNVDEYPLMNPYVPQQSPETPTINGPKSGVPNQEYSYSLTNTVDPEGDLIYAFWNWGDGDTSEWEGPYNSGDEIFANHSWSSKGSYEIKAKLKDENGKESGWATLQVSIPRDKVKFNFLLSNFIEQFPILSRYLNLLVSGIIK
jgi:parallel beta-helix repeat protein